MFAFDFRNDQLSHKIGDKSRFTRSHGTYNADIYVSVSTFADVFIDIKLLHIKTNPPRLDIRVYAGGLPIYDLIVFYFGVTGKP